MFGPSLHWVAGVDPGRLALMARPQGGEWLADDIAALRGAGLIRWCRCSNRPKSVNSTFGTSHRCVNDTASCFARFPSPTEKHPRPRATCRCCSLELQAELRDGRSVAIHCRAGIRAHGAGRRVPASSAAGAVQGHLPVAQPRPGGVAVPDTDAQVEWVERFVRTRAGANTNA